MEAANLMGPEEVAALIGRLKREDRTLISKAGLHALHEICVGLREVPGNAVEVGVRRGGSAYLIAIALPEKTVYACDTFAGIPHVDPERDPYYKLGAWAAEFSEVEAFLEPLGNVAIVPGVFPQATGDAVPEPLCLAHIDVDVYESALRASLHIFPLMSPGGLVLYDDYGFPECGGVKLAVDELVAAGLEGEALRTGQFLASGGFAAGVVG